MFNAHIANDNELDVSKNIPFSQSEDTAESDEIQRLPCCVRLMFETRKSHYDPYFDDIGDNERGNWDTPSEYVLTCIGYAVGLGNLWRFPSKVYQGGGGAFLIPYLTFCLIFGGPMMMLELCLGQFCGLGVSRAFELCPILSGIGWTISVIAFLVTINYVIVITWCFFYLVSSFQTVIPWSVCNNTFNTPKCINTSTNPKDIINGSYLESSTIQFWNMHVSGEQRKDGTYHHITDGLNAPNPSLAICMLVVLCISALSIMFGVKVSGKIIYITVIFPYIAIIQFVILGCTLPGALKGVKFYLYPNSRKLLDPQIYLSALDQLLFSSGVAAGGLITMSSFNRFKSNVYQSVIIVMITGFLTSFISGFAIFSVLGYMSYKSGKEIKDLIKADSSIFFISYPEALATLDNPNLWSILFMFMVFTLGIDSLFVLLETVTMSIADSWPILHKKENKVYLTITVTSIIFALSLIFITPGGSNLLTLFEIKISPFLLTFGVVLEVFSVCFVYGLKNFQHDIELMLGQKLGLYWVVTICFVIPTCAIIILVIIIRDTTLITRYGKKFPAWTNTVSWIFNVLVFCPILGVGITVIVRTKLKHPKLTIFQTLKLSTKPPPTWGPKSKRYWTQVSSYSRKLLKYKDHPLLLKSLAENDDIKTLILRAENLEKLSKPNP